MRAVEITQPGTPEVLRTASRPTPLVFDHDVLIRVEAAGVNRADILQRRGLYAPPRDASDIPGLEVAGVVETIGLLVTRFKPGDKVCALVPGGGYAELALAHEALCAPIPPNLSMIEAAACPEALFTVWNNVFVRGRLKYPGETLLVHGGTSGIGTFAIQMAHALGNPVYATTSSLEKAKHCQRLGAQAAISRNNEDYVKVIQQLVPRGIHVVLDMSGGETLARDFQIMAQDGRHVSIAYMEGKTSTIDIATLMQKRLVLTGSTLRGRPLPELALIAQGLDRVIWPLLAAGKITPVIDNTFPLERAADAHKHLEQGHHVGKIVLTV